MSRYMPMNFATQQLNSLTLVKVFPRATICVPYGDDVEIGLLPAGKTPLEIITGSMTNRYTDLLRRVSPEPNEVAFLHRLQIGWMTLPNNIFGGTVVQINGKMILVHKGLIENRKACQSWKSWTSSCTRLEEGL